MTASRQVGRPHMGRTSSWQPEKKCLREVFGSQLFSFRVHAASYRLKNFGIKPSRYVTDMWWQKWWTTNNPILSMFSRTTPAVLKVRTPYHSTRAAKVKQCLLFEATNGQPNGGCFLMPQVLSTCLAGWDGYVVLAKVVVQLGEIPSRDRWQISAMRRSINNIQWSLPEKYKSIKAFSHRWGFWVIGLLNAVLSQFFSSEPTPLIRRSCHQSSDEQFRCWLLDQQELNP